MSRQILPLFEQWDIVREWWYGITVWPQRIPFVNMYSDVDTVQSNLKLFKISRETMWFWTTIIFGIFIVVHIVILAIRGVYQNAFMKTFCAVHTFCSSWKTIWLEVVVLFIMAAPVILLVYIWMANLYTEYEGVEAQTWCFHNVKGRYDTNKTNHIMLNMYSYWT